MGNQKNIVIIGAGVAGLNAAWYLAENGHKVTIYEATDQIGGRARSFLDSKSGDLIDNGQHILIGAYNEFLSLLEKIGTKEHIFKQKALKTVFRHESVSVFDTSKLPGKFGFLYGFYKFDLLNKEEKKQIISFYRNYNRKTFDKETTALKLLKSFDQGDQLIKKFWEPLIVSALNTKIEEASANIFINILNQGFFKNKRAAAIYIPKVSFNELFSKFEHENINIELNSPINEINFEGNTIKSVITRNHEVTADEFISCVPPYVLKRLINNKKMKYLDEFEYSSIVSIYLWYDNNFIENDFEALLGGNFDWIFNKSNIDKNRSQFANGFFTLSKSAADHMLGLNDKKILTLALEDIYKFYNFPLQPKHFRVFKEKFATIKSTPKSDLIRPENTTQFTNFKIAGEWTNTGFPSTLEGATISGREAAKLIV